MGIFCAFAGLVKPKEVRQLYADADCMQQMRDHAKVMNRLRGAASKTKEFRIGIVYTDIDKVDKWFCELE